jgi:hypothetical protein
MLITKHCACSSPFKGEVRWGMGLISMKFNPIPTPTLPLKGREKYSGALKSKVGCACGVKSAQLLVGCGLPTFDAPIGSGAQAHPTTDKQCMKANHV